jgi:MarR family transcriptional regulator, organic hydroperoxide resistance regulator
MLRFVTRFGRGSCEAWQLLLELFFSERSRVPSIAAELDLSAMQVHVLRLIDPDRPAPMRRLADGLACDASNITGIVDRLEARGLLERRGARHDRRVKVVAFTARGVEVRGRILERLSEPPAPIARLSVEDQRALCAILRKALGESAGPRRRGGAPASRCR